MAWLRIDDRVRTHPKMHKAGIAGWLWLCGICYCREHLTDGVIPSEALPTLAPGIVGMATKHAQHLVAVGLWHVHPDGFEVHDFLDWNPKRSEVESERTREKDRKRKERGQNADGGDCPSGQFQDASRVGAGAPARARDLGLERGVGKTKPRPIEDGAGDDFWQTWRRLFAETQNGATVLDLSPRAKDIEHVVALVEAYPDAAYLAQMAELYLRLDVPDLRHKPRSIGMFRHWAPFCDTELRLNGLAPTVGAA